MGKIFNALEKSKNKEFQETRNKNSEKSENELNHHEDFTKDRTSDPIQSIMENVGKQTEGRVEDIQTEDLKSVNPKIITAHAPYSVESEQFRQLKNSILFPDKGIPAQTIMVTSTSPNEGKSFVAANLAVSIAQSIDEHVLLIDCDLRSPTIHTMFGFENVYGLSNYLSGEKPLSSVFLKTFLHKLSILPGGQIPANPSELLSSEQMRRLIHEVKMRYTDRYIILDTPPPYLTSETNAIARHVDGIIIVVRKRKARQKDIQKLIDIYGRKKVLGVIMNYSTKKPRYGYGYSKYGYGK